MLTVKSSMMSTNMDKQLVGGIERNGNKNNDVADGDEAFAASLAATAVETVDLTNRQKILIVPFPAGLDLRKECTKSTIKRVRILKSLVEITTQSLYQVWMITVRSRDCTKASSKETCQEVA
jgi:hypothetical protein